MFENLDWRKLLKFDSKQLLGLDIGSSAAKLVQMLKGKLLKFDSKQLLGLDIGSSAVKLVQMTKDSSGYVVTSAEIAEIVDGGVTDENSREANTIRAIHSCLESSKTQSKLAVCSLSGEQVALRPFQFPKLPADEIEGAVYFEADQVCPFNVGDGAVDYQLIPSLVSSEEGNEDGGNVKGVLAAATNNLIQNRKKMAEGAALDTVLMDVDGLALLNCFNEYQKGLENGGGAVILNVGANWSNLVMMDDDGTPLVRDMAYAGNQIIERLAELTSVQEKDIKELLFDGKEAANICHDFRERLQAASEELVVDVNETLRYYTTQRKSSVVGKLYVCGGFAPAEGFVELLNNQLIAEAVLWNPFEKIRYKVSPACEQTLQKKGSAMAVATGLAMRSI